uniref:LRRCT domain-containing protein n=1 Tax=Pelusios castaneus TaxID=367368 RepID=A0A8C8RD46_9SAUR
MGSGDAMSRCWIMVLVLLWIPVTAITPFLGNVQCPVNCSCFFPQRFVQCTNTSLSSLPNGIPNATLELDLLRNNSLESLSSLTSLKSLYTLYLTGNKWRCDCNLIWLRTWQKKVIRSERSPVVCSSPGVLQGQLLVDIEVTRSRGVAHHEGSFCSWHQLLLNWRVRPGQRMAGNLTLLCVLWAAHEYIRIHMQV